MVADCPGRCDVTVREHPDSQGLSDLADIEAEQPRGRVQGGEGEGDGDEGDEGLGQFQRDAQLAHEEGGSVDERLHVGTQPLGHVPGLVMGHPEIAREEAGGAGQHGDESQ